MNETDIRNQARAHIVALLINDYLPKISTAINTCIYDSYDKIKLCDQISQIVDAPVTIDVGQLNIKKPTDELVDKLTDLIVSFSTHGNNSN